MGRDTGSSVGPGQRRTKYAQQAVRAGSGTADVWAGARQDTAVAAGNGAEKALVVLGQSGRMKVWVMRRGLRQAGERLQVQHSDGDGIRQSELGGESGNEALTWEETDSRGVQTGRD
jgi:hypothetical protein